MLCVSTTHRRLQTSRFAAIRRRSGPMLAAFCLLAAIAVFSFGRRLAAAASAKTPPFFWAVTLPEERLVKLPASLFRFFTCFERRLEESCGTFVCSVPFERLLQLLPENTAHAVSLLNGGNLGVDCVNRRGSSTTTSLQRVPHLACIVPRHVLSFGEAIGRGSSAACYRVVMRHDDARGFFVCKRLLQSVHFDREDCLFPWLSVENGDTASDAASPLNEFKLARIGRSDALAKYHAVIVDLAARRYVGFLLEWAPGGSLRAFLLRNAKRVLPSVAWMRSFAAVARLLNALHAKGVLHRDVRLENVLVSGDVTAHHPPKTASSAALLPFLKLSDFGLSCDVAAAAAIDISAYANKEEYLCGKVYAPELFDAHSKQNAALDWYMFGTLIANFCCLAHHGSRFFSLLGFLVEDLVHPDAANRDGFEGVRRYFEVLATEATSNSDFSDVVLVEVAYFECAAVERAAYWRDQTQTNFAADSSPISALLWVNGSFRTKLRLQPRSGVFFNGYLLLPLRSIVTMYFVREEAAIPLPVLHYDSVARNKYRFRVRENVVFRVERNVRRHIAGSFNRFNFTRYFRHDMIIINANMLHTAFAFDADTPPFFDVVESINLATPRAIVEFIKKFYAV